MLQYSPSHWDVGDELLIAGIVDLDAIPEEKRYLPLGDEDNPIPLVEFTNVSDADHAQLAQWSRAPIGKRSPKSRKKKRKRKKRR
ncbi:MAG: hypothetical protein J7M34_03625 [Anaerolineae bacterium]|nr:hypothetical protein [Anaerolineae bacterium]